VGGAWLKPEVQHEERRNAGGEADWRQYVREAKWQANPCSDGSIATYTSHEVRLVLEGEARDAYSGKRRAGEHRFQAELKSAGHGE
jgi:hypothetical protein